MVSKVLEKSLTAKAFRRASGRTHSISVLRIQEQNARQRWETKRFLKKKQLPSLLLPEEKWLQIRDKSPPPYFFLFGAIFQKEEMARTGIKKAPYLLCKNSFFFITPFRGLGPDTFVGIMALTYKKH